MAAASKMTEILDVMNVIQQPMFLLDVAGPENFVFQGLNLAHERLTGMKGDDLFGLKPHDALPSRLADTIVQNYEVCRSTGAEHTYEEILELPNGLQWWQTTLSPVFDPAGEVVQIVGVAFDITKRKDKVFEASQKLSEMTRLNEDLQVFASVTAHDMRGPFQTMVALVEMVMDGFVDLGDEKCDQLALCREIAEDAIASMTNILATAHSLKVATEEVDEVDLGHLTADIAALLDPHQRLNIELPQTKVTTDRVAMQMVLRNLMENAMRYADKNISIVVAENSKDQLEITVSDDGVGMSVDKRSDGQIILPKLGQIGSAFGINSAQAIVAARGGSVVRAPCAYATGAAIRFALPGRLAGSAKLVAAKPAAAQFQKVSGAPAGNAVSGVGPA